MGQASSKRNSTQSTAPLNPSGQESTNYNSATYPSTPTTYDSPLPPLPYEQGSITQPLPPQHLNRISALVDPRDLIGFLPEERQAPYSYHASSRGSPASQELRRQRACMVESPSGRLLDHQAYLLHPNRPLTIRERQEAIRLNLERAEAAEKAQKLERSLRAKPSRVFSSLNGPKNRPSNANLHSAYNAPRPQPSAVNLNSSFNTVRHPPSAANLASTSTLNVQDDAIIPARSIGAFEQAKIEEGKREWEEKQVAKEGKKRKCGGGCLGHCFGLCMGARNCDKA